MAREHFPCKWGACNKHFEAVEDLFNHLTDEHVGRKSTNNLCLECHWENCRTVAAKRDHLASHLRVHLPLKPHHCQLCKKGFKRPQDLKKHERIHTIEHQASLLSNQPGYKPQRRRRKPAQSTPSNKGSSEASSCSPSFACMPSPEHEDNPKLFQDPLQGFINDILMDQTQPSYNTEMITRLNSIAPALQYQSNWSLPCAPESIPTLQNWLEQLSSNIQTDDNIYPSITTENHVNNNNNNGNLATVDYDLYPKLDDNNEWTTPSFTTQSEKTDDSPATPPMSQATASPMPKDDEIKSPNFWTPGFVSANVNEAYQSEDMSMRDGPFPSEPIDFTTMIRPSSHVEPNSIFETTKQESDPIKPNLDSSVSFAEKQTLVEMINQFKSPYDDVALATRKPTISDQLAVVEKNACNTNMSHKDRVEESEKEEEEEEEEEEEFSSSDEDYYGYSGHAVKGDKSPYNELLDSIENMHLEDEETTRKRHLKLIDNLYQFISKAS